MPPQDGQNRQQYGQNRLIVIKSKVLLSQAKVILAGCQSGNLHFSTPSEIIINSNEFTTKCFLVISIRQTSEKQLPTYN